MTSSTGTAQTTAPDPIADRLTDDLVRVHGAESIPVGTSSPGASCVGGRETDVSAAGRGAPSSSTTADPSTHDRVSTAGFTPKTPPRAARPPQAGLPKVFPAARRSAPSHRRR